MILLMASDYQVMAEAEDDLMVNGVLFQTRLGAMAAWMRTQGDSPDVLWQMLLTVREECPADLEAFATVERVWVASLGIE